MRHAARILAATFVVLLALGLGAPTAAAHANLVAVDPPDGARLDESPDEVQLTFSERVSASLGGIRVLDADGQRVDEGAVRVDGRAVEVDLAPDLADGTYVISYRIVSADGHPVRGGSVFGVGEGEVDTGALGRVQEGDDDRLWEVVGAVGRGFAYAGTLLAAGGVLFLLHAHRGDAATAPERPRLVRLVRAAAILGGVAGLVALPVQAALGTGQGPQSLFDDGVLAEVGADGVALALGAALAGLAVAVLVLERNGALATAGALVAAASFAATGHTRAGGAALLAGVSDVVHLLVVAVWGAGIVLLWQTLRSRRLAEEPAEAGDTAGIVGRFSTMATVTVLAAAVTGAALSWNEVRTIGAIGGTGYGRLLLLKVALVMVVAALGAYNHLRLVPALAPGKTNAALRQLRRTLQLESFVLVGVLAATAVLVVVTPGRTEAAGGPVERVVELGELGSVQVVVAPARAGFNQIHLYTFDPDGRPTNIADSVTLGFSLPAAGLGPIEREATRAGPAHLQLNGNDLAVSGTWEISVRVRADRFTEVAGITNLPVAR
ncbi:MAG: copper resistance protein CopC [Acidimicrobiales bacterium]|nr:copper resistance protein CopC [Acidimicrobiales bacterium]